MNRLVAKHMTVEEQVRIIKLVREETGYPFMAIKRALVECNFNIDAAIRLLEQPKPKLPK